MSGGITVKEFKHIPGVNDAEYIKKLEELHEIDKGIISKAVAKIKMLSAQPERKTGQWIPDNTDYYRTKFICSACGESEEVPTTGFGYGTMWDYCPMCGAKMERGEQE